MLLKDSIAAKKAEKAAKAAAPVEVTTDAPKDPAWDAVRETTRQMAGHGRMFLRCQVRLGMLLDGLKKAHGVSQGKRSATSAESAEVESWPDKVKRETGYSYRSTEVFIAMFHGTVAKLKAGKKLNLPAPAKKNALVLFQTESALTLTTEQWETVDHVIGTLTEGETQKGLMQHLGLIPGPAVMPKGTKGEKAPEPTAGQMAFLFFDPVASSLITARTNPEYKKLLCSLPLESTEEQKLSLATLEAEMKATLADIEEIKAANLKATRGRSL
ncbi:hypothetical protein OVA24_16630 [Luteolibacter sp. SL250]|uniref:hypothetical protein n=1 Tax=Luteolibacter sp. SL250 TaxID=2995170 RepID=UPI00226F93EA|nr:hypothetical protein [Luteolibacter sp. SL250]WAC18858.1 hypothetical protein OVA24_16630 [Luteolibacter sp. SL250]